MIPTAVLMIMYWLLLHVWLKQVSQQQISAKLITSLGCVAGVALILYTVTLGAKGEPYALARRLGVVFYFAFSSFAHLPLLAKLKQLNTRALNIHREQQALLHICIVLVSSSILSAVAGFFWPAWEHWENAYEWWFSLLMISLFFLVGRMWKKTNFNVLFRIDSAK